MKHRQIVSSFFTLCIAISFIFACNSVAEAGTIETIPLEDKGVSLPSMGLNIFPSEVQVSHGMFGWTITVTLWNAEVVNVSSVGPAVRVFNVYPDAAHVPQVPSFDPNNPIDFFFFMAVDSDTTQTSPVSGLGPLPGGWTVEQATMTGTSGTGLSAEITPISDLANLPTSSPNLTAIEWDLSAFSQTTGNFFLAKVTFPNAYELVEPDDIPTLNEWALVFFGLLLMSIATVLIYRRRIESV